MRQEIEKWGVFELELHQPETEKYFQNPFSEGELCARFQNGCHTMTAGGRQPRPRPRAGAVSLRLCGWDAVLPYGNDGLRLDDQCAGNAPQNG